MRVLRLGNSDDVDASVPPEQKNWYVAARVLEEAVGEPVETIVRPIRPDSDLPDRVEEWIDEYEPEFVFLKVTWVWYGYESVPRRIERLLGRAGHPIARAGLSAARKPRMAHTWWFKAGRRAAHRMIGGDTQWHSDHVLSTMEATIRRVVARENVALLVKGTGGSRTDREGILKGQFERFTERRLYVEGGVERLCRRLGVAYVSTGPRKTDEQRDIKRGDGLHPGSTGHYWMGIQEGKAMVEAWQAASAGTADSPKASA